MRRHDGTVVLDFPLPAGAPPAVERAAAGFNELVEQLSSARHELGLAVEFVDVARATDIAEVGEALANRNAPPKDAHARERQARAVETELRDRVADLEAACDFAGNRLAAVIEEARDDWLTVLHAENERAAGELRKALDAVAAALDRLAVPAEIEPWLADFATWKLEPDRRLLDTMKFSRRLPLEISQAFSAFSALSATVATLP